MDIDWPSVKSEIESRLYEDDEPLPVVTDDLAALVRARPTGPVTSQLPWERLGPDDFERLMLELLRQAPGYENPNLLMPTNATDRGRDVEAIRVAEDVLAGSKRYRVIVQCKHWREKSVGRSELVNCIEAVKLWEPPRVDVLVVATTGRFSQDSVATAESRNHRGDLPTVALWPDVHLEHLLAVRPSIAAAFGLR